MSKQSRQEQPKQRVSVERTRRGRIGPISSCSVYTPPELAHALVSSLGVPDDARWLEPSFGAGIFLKALAGFGIPRTMITAVDLSRRTADADGLANAIRGVDFLAWSRRTRYRFDRVIGNPPFFPIRRLPERLRRPALSTIGPDHEPVGYANYWYAFLCASISLLETGGDIGFVLPAAWEYADYAEPLRERLPNFFQQTSIWRSAEPLFPGVQEGSVVLVARGYGGGPGRLSRHSYGRARGLVRALRVDKGSPDTILPKKKPTALRRSNKHVRLGDLLRLRIGAVTGDANYFLLTDSRRRTLQIPTKACLKVVSKSRHLVGTEITQALWQMLREADERVWLFYPRPAVHIISSVRRYLRLRSERGGCNREANKIRQRIYWYLTTLPPTPHGFISGMSHTGPWISFSNTKGLTATNTLYTVRFAEDSSRSKRHAIGLSMLTTLARQQIAGITRVYPDGLMKIEPGQLANIRLLLPSRTAGAITAYREAVQLLRSGESLAAQEVADAWIEQN